MFLARSASRTRFLRRPRGFSDSTAAAQKMRLSHNEPLVAGGVTINLLIFFNGNSVDWLPWGTRMRQAKRHSRMPFWRRSNPNWPGIQIAIRTYYIKRKQQ